jgi:hypothetical protein
MTWSAVAVLRRVVGGSDVGVQRGGHGPRLRAVDHDLHEPDRPVVGAQPSPGLAGLGVEPGHPGLVTVPGKRCQLLGPAVRAGGEAAGDPGALGEVIVIRPAPVGLYVVPGGGRCAGVDLHAAVHFSTPPNNDQHVTPSNGSGPREARPGLPPLVACVPFFGKGSNVKGWGGHYGQKAAVVVVSLAAGGNC